MDKKSKFSQSSAKGAASDSKKNQEVVNTKLFPKTSHKREPAGASHFPKYEHPRKYNVQKTKNFDKRPKPKGQYHGGAKEDTEVVEELAAEVRPVLVQGSKKQNLNHLLNFYYEPRDVHSGSNGWTNGKSSKGYNRNSNRWLPPIQRHKYNKEQFLQASCQFVVSANEDYSLYLTDPDILVNWDLIEQIKIHSSDKLSCPICLYPPVAGKMTRCGHVYCWPCILHYLSLSDKSWRKCPICYESVHKSDLKSVVEVTQTAFNSGDIISLCLMRREKGSLLATPVLGSISPTPTAFFSVSENTDNKAYSKLLIAHKNDVMNIIELERAQLNIELMDNPNTPENCYIDEALNDLSKREESLAKRKDLKSNTEVTLKKGSTELYASKGNEQTNKDEGEKQQSELPIRAENLNSVCKVNTLEGEKVVDIPGIDVQNNGTLQKFFYFYQAQDGQHMYLHAMNVKMLEMQYGSLENSPSVITGKLLEKETGSFTEDLRRRLRYLCHLPLTCQFEVAEIELEPPIVSEEVLRSFQDQFELRQRRRQRRAREEKRREKKITEEENKRMGKYPIPNVHLESQEHFPEWQPEILFAEDNIPSAPESIASSSIANSPSSSTFDEVASSIGEMSSIQEPGPSFAEMLRNKKTCFKSEKKWPSIQNTHSTLQAGINGQSSSTDREEEEYTLVPSYSQRFGDALAQALEHSKLSDGVSKASTDAMSGKRKKKKNKPTVLFATSMARTS